MSKKTKKKSNSSFLTTFMEFWTTLPGILTGIAAVITASAGLYLAFVHTNIIDNPVPPPSIPVNSLQGNSSPTPESSPNNCLKQDSGELNSIEAGSPEQTLEPSAGVIRIKLTDNHQTVGTLCLKFYPDGRGYFEIEQLIDSKGEAVKGLYNETTSEYVENKLGNDDSLDIPLGGRKYSLRLMSHGGKSTAKFNKL
ncbi:MAG: hypothetical protein ACJ74T_11175 [Pyrinomonadaceae bacterium]